MMRNLLQRNFQSAKQTPAALEQPDRLEAEDILPIASGHSGVPEAADSLAYDPVQRLLAVRAVRLGLIVIAFLSCVSVALIIC